MTPSNYQKMRTDFKEYLKAKAFTGKSIRSRMGVIDRYFTWLDKENLEAEQVSYNDLLLYIKLQRSKGVNQRTVQHYMGAIKHFYQHLLQEGKVTINPASDIEVKGVKRKMLYHILEPHELHGLYNQYPAETLQERHNKTMLGMLVYQGLKTEELARLEVKDIKLREGLIHVPGSRRSNGREMKLEVHQVMDMYDYVLQVRPQLIQMNLNGRSETEKLFIGQSKSSNRLRSSMAQLMARVRKINPSIENGKQTCLTARQVRASVITKWLKAHNLREVQYLAGHRYISSTEGYIENDMDGLKDEIQQYHPLG